MMLHAFEAGTDTQQMWGSLQVNCLLAPRKKREETPRPPTPAQPPKREPRAAGGIRKVAPPPAPAAPAAVRKPARTPPPAPRREVERERREAPPSHYCLVLQGGRHRIALPIEGEIVLGRFDPTVKVNPDIDLSHDDRNSHAISRRHARIVCRNGRFEIEDLGSTNGTRVNGKRLWIGQKMQLQPGDRVILGYHEFSYRPVPVATTSLYTSSLAYLWVTFTDHQFPLPAQGQVIIGRRDPATEIVPDIDLSQEGEVARVVARRHVRVVAHGGRHYVEDLGSASGVKLNGTRIRIGEIGLLERGDHLWLGGCVLAYDIKR